jgi:uncharacterized protein YciI
MEFDSFTIALLITNPTAPQLDEEAAARLQDAHLNYLAELHEAGHLLMAGPLLGGEGEPFRGLTLLNADAEEAVALAEADPAVRAGRFTVKVLPWMVPAGAVTFSRTRFPHSAAEVQGE